MNKEQTKEAIAVMQAFVDGKEIEFRSTHSVWMPLLKDVAWNLNAYTYRVKPEIVKYRRVLMVDKYHEGAVKHYLRLVEHPDNKQSTGFTVEGITASPNFVRWIDNDWQEEVV